jgi:hypothetical protein
MIRAIRSAHVVMRFIFVSLIGICLHAPALAQQTLESYVEKQVLAGRYMSPQDGCKAPANAVFAWPAAELQRCEYDVTDKLKDGTKRKKKAVVYLANPTPARVLIWLKTACGLAKPDALDSCVRGAADAIRGASGAQFPVAGLVWEDQSCGDPLGVCKNGSDGVNEGYIFRNGVTVRIEGFTNASTDPVTSDLEKLATAQKVTGVKGSGGYARIISTTREAFRDFTGRKDIPVGKSEADSAIAWSDMVGAAYRAALSDAGNPLISATLCEKYNWPKACKPKLN